MTLLEYITDLQSQGLSGEEIFAKAQEFKGRTKPEEVVEEVKIDPVVETDATTPGKTEPVSNEKFMKSISGDGIFDSLENTTLSQRLNATPRTSKDNPLLDSVESDFDIKDFQNRTFFQKVGVEPVFTLPDSYKTKADVGQTYNPKGNYDYKYEINQKTGSIDYYYKATGSKEDWKTYKNKESDANLAIASQFGHFDYDKYKKQQKYIKDFSVNLNIDDIDIESFQKNKTLKADQKVLLDTIQREYNNSRMAGDPYITFDKFKSKYLKSKKITEPETKTESLNDKINNLIIEKNLDKNYIYQQFQNQGYTGQEDFRPEMGLIKLDDAFNFKNLGATIGKEDLKEFVGFMNSKKFTNNYVDNFFNDSFGDQGTYDISNEEYAELKIAGQRSLDNYLNQFLNEKNNRYNNKLYLNYIKNNPDKFKDIKSLSEAKTKAKAYFKKEYGQSTFPAFDYNKIKNYREVLFPELVKKEKLNLIESEEKRKKLIEEGSSEGLLKDSMVKLTQGYLSQAEDQALAIREMFGFDIDVGRNLKNEKDIKRFSQDIRYMYVEGKKAEVDGIVYIKEDDGSIYDTTNKISLGVKTEDELKKINLALDNSKETGSDFSGSGGVEMMAATFGTMAYDLSQVYGLGKFTKAAKLGKLTQIVKMPRATFDALAYYSFSGYVTTKKDTYNEAIKAGISKEEAQDLSETAGQLGGAWYGVTSLFAPTNTYMKRLDKAFSNNNAINQALKFYEKKGKGGFVKSMLNSIKNIKPTSVGLQRTALAGGQEVLQENLQEGGMVLGLNPFINNLTDENFLNEDYSRSDFIKTSILSFGAGSAFSNISIPSFKPNASQQLKNLYLLGQDVSGTKKLTNEMVANGQATQDQVGALMQDIKAVYNQTSKIPATVSAETQLESAKLLQKIQDLEIKKKRVNENFHGPINELIDKNKKKLAEIVKPEIEKSKSRKGAKKMAEQLGSTFETFKDQSSIDERVEELKKQGGQPQSSASYGQAIDMSGIEGYEGPNKIILINDQVAAEDNVYTTDQHEILHPFWSQTLKGNPEVAIAFGTSLLNELENNPNVVINDPEVQRRVDQYIKDGVSTSEVMEEVMNFTSEALSNGSIVVTPKKLSIIGRLISKVFGQAKQPLNIRFDKGSDVLDFLVNYNETIEAGKGFTEQQLKIAKEGAKGKLIDDASTGAVVESLRDNQIPVSAQEFTYDDGGGELNIAVVKTNLDGSRQLQLKQPDGSVISTTQISKNNTLSNEKLVDTSAGDVKSTKDLDIKTIRNPKVDDRMSDRQRKAAGLPIKQTGAKSSKLPESTEVYMSLTNEQLQQGLNEAIQNKTDQQFPIAQAIVEKNWPLISKSLDINSPQQMDAAKEVVIDQILGQFEGSGQGKYAPRNTSALAGFSLEGGAQVNTYLAETIRRRKPEIDLAIKERTGSSSELNTNTSEEVASVTTETETVKAKKSPKGDAIYNSVLQGNLGSDVATAVDTAIESDLLDMNVGDKFAKTNKLGPALGKVLGKAFGLNPEVFTIKSRNIAKKDLKGLTNLRQYLTANAQSDFSNLPDAYDSSGKSTFIPNSILESLYIKDGKGKWKLDSSKTLADYKNLIGSVSTDKPIYRSKDATIAKALAGLSFRNKMFETAVPDPVKRKTTGVKFSKRKNYNTVVQISIAKQIQDYGLKLYPTFENRFLHDKMNSDQIKGRNESVIRSLPELGLDFFEYISSRGDDAYAPGIANSSRSIFNKKGNINELRDLLNAPLSSEFIKDNPAYVKKYTKTVNGKVYLDKDKLRVGTVLSVKDMKIIREAEANQAGYANLSPEKRIQRLKDKNFRDNQADKSIILKKILNVISKDVRVDNKIVPARMEFWASWINSQVNNSKHPIRVLAPIKFFSLSKIPKRSTVEGYKLNKKGEVVSVDILNYVAEHLMPANNTAKIAVDLIYNNSVNKDFSLIKDNYVQGQLLKTDDNDVNDKNIGQGSFKSQFPNEFWDMDKPNVWIRYLLGNPNIDLNAYITYKDGKIMTIAESLGLPLTNSQITPNSISLQNKLILEILGLYKDKDGAYKLKEPRSIKSAKAKMNVYINNINKPKAKQSKRLTEQFTPKLPDNVTTEKKIKVLNDYDTTSKISRALNTPEKGISVFDFDDTLAKTKEKVIVNMADGKSQEISASEFAAQASELQEAGATFNFDNFENVGKGTQKGPLADLALRRQGKFGSKDIFVLTARPQIAATDIKMFLDGIGLNLPIENITGLEDGSPQAKANWVISKTAEGYNNFYFADDAIKNVKAVKEILDQVDVKSKVQIAKASKRKTFDKIINDILENSTGIKSEAEFSRARAQTVGAGKGKFTFFTTPSAEDFVGLIYKFLGKGKVGNAQFKFFQDNLIDPYNRAEQAVTRAKITAANDFKALKNSLKTLPKSLSKKTGIGGFTFGQAARVAVWTRQGMEVPGLSKRDAKELNAFIDNNAELDVFVDELINIQKGKPYPKPSQTWLAGNITSDIVNEINKVNRKEYMQEFNENIDIIFSDKVMNKLEAAYGPKYVEALRDIIRRMKSGSNRPVGNSRIVDGLLNWLNNSVGAIMFLNTRSAVLQTISAVNFINFGNNNILAAGRAFANQKQYWKDFMTLFNSPYLVERRDGLKINVSESEIADAVSESSNKPKAFLNLLLSKGFVLTRFADSFAIAAGGSTFYRNQVKAYVKGGMDQKAAEKQAFDDFYAIAEESQQSSNPSKISQQQASGAGRVILAFANTPMQYARIIKRSSQDLVNGRGDWKTNVSKIVYYGAMQNLIFNALSNALFALAFDEEDEEQEDKTGRIANGMADSLLRGLGIRGAAVSAVKDALITVYEEENKEKGAPELRKAITDLFGFSPPLDSKIRKLTSGLNTLSWEREKMNQEGFNLNNPAYLAFAQVISGLTNVPLDRAITKINNLRAVTSDSSDKWQKVALLMGWSAWDLGLPYYGVEDKVEMTPQMILKEKVNKMKKETSTKQQKETLLKLGLTKQQIKALKYEEARVKKIIELQEKKDGKN